MIKETDPIDDLPVILHFWAPWCAHCKRMAPALKRMEERFQGQVILQRINADKQLDKVNKYRVRAVPTLIILSGGEEKMRFTGAQSDAALAAMFQSAVDGNFKNRSTVTPVNRALRLGSGAIIIILALLKGPNWWLVALGAVIAFWGWYDRCPIWQSLWSRITALFQRKG
jgi:thioredoxin